MGIENCIDCDERQAAIDCNCIPIENADGTLQDIVIGCTDPLATNYDPLANCDDGSCIDKISGCMDPTSLNYSSCYNADCDGNLPGSAAYIVGGTYGVDTCCCSIAGCTDPAANNYNVPAGACLDDGSCEYDGCTNNTACNYDPQATVDDGSCTYPPTASATVTSCNSYLWTLDGNTYNSSGTHYHTAAGYCPLTTTLNLTINNDSSTSDTQTACGTYTWGINGQTYTTSGTYTDVGTNAAGCTHTETLNLTIQSLGCTNPLSLNYDPTAICDDGSCINCQNGCTYGGGSLPTWTSLIADGGPNTSSTWAALYPSEPTPSQAASNYNGSATCEDGTCVFDIYGCTDPTACNYDPTATIDDSSCIDPPTMALDGATDGEGSPNGILASGAGGTDEGMAASYQMCAYPYESGEPMFGAHCTEGVGGGFILPDGVSTTWSETYFFELGTGTSGSGVNEPLTIGQSYCITWGEIVMKLITSGQCSDCYEGGWDVRIDNTITGSSPSWGDINSATSLYDPVATGTLTVADNGITGIPNSASVICNHDDSLCSTNDSGNVNCQNTPGASNGSASRWNSKCVEFTASATQHRIHFIAVTDFTLCTGCHWNGGTTVFGTYVGISKVQISNDCSGSCTCA